MLMNVEEFYLHYIGNYIGKGPTTPKAPSPKSLSFSFKHTATGVFRLDSLNKTKAKCHNGVKLKKKMLKLLFKKKNLS